MIYAVNKRTKEHVVYKQDGSQPEMVGSDSWRFVEADADGWIAWSGGERPLPARSDCDIRHRDGEEFTGCLVDMEDWEHMDGFRMDIIAYRPILDAKPEAPAWDGGLPPVGVECEYRLPQGWASAKVIGYDGPACVVAVDGHGYFGNTAESAFRPIRSDEDRAVEEMASVMRGTDVMISGAHQECLARALCRAIRDGKIPGVKLEEAS